MSKARLGAEVARRREAAALGVAELAARAGLDEAVVSAIERGERRVSSHELQAVAEALGVEELELLRRPPPGYLILPGAPPPGLPPRERREVTEDLIPVLGTLVSVAEVEARLLDHPSVAEAAVIGLPDAFTGFALKAFVRLAPSSQATPKELVAFCRRQMPAHAYPRQVEIVEALPRAASGVIDRRRLGDLELARMRRSGL